MWTFGFGIGSLRRWLARLGVIAHYVAMLGVVADCVAFIAGFERHWALRCWALAGFAAYCRKFFGGAAKRHS